MAITAPDGLPPVGWGELSRRARVWRAIHASWSVGQLGCLAYIWSCAMTRRRNVPLWGGVAFLLVEAGALVAGHGSCPMGRLQEEWGDPVPFFELILPPRAARAAIPFLAAVSVGAITALALRKPGLVIRA